MAKKKASRKKTDKTGDLLSGLSEEKEINEKLSEKKIHNKKTDEKLSTVLKNPLEHDPYCIPLTRDDLITVLASGIITPCYPEKPYITIFQNGISSSLYDIKDFLPDSSDSNFTVLLEIEYPVIQSTESGMTGISDSGEVEGTVDAEDLKILFFSGVLPVSVIKTIHFKSDKDKDNFLARGYENVPVKNFKSLVTEKLFNQELSEECIKTFNEHKPEMPVKSEKYFSEVMAISDSYLGFLAILTHIIPADENWMNFVKDLLDEDNRKKLNLKSLDLKSNNIIKDNLEFALFNSAYKRILQEHESGGGQDWQSKEILKDIYNDVDRGDLSERELTTLDKWFNRCTKILNNEADTVPLTDESYRVARAILLVLLRPSPEDIIKSEASSLKPGAEVLAFAVILSGIRYGFSALPNKLKSVSGEKLKIFSNLRADFVNSLLDSPVIDDEIVPAFFFPYKAEVIKKHSGLMGQDLQIKVGDNIFLERHIEGPVELRLVNAIAEIAGITLKHERRYRRLSYIHDSGKRKQEVFLSPGGLYPNKKKERTIILWSKCVDLKTPIGKKLLQDESFLKDLLKTNVSPEIFCNIGMAGENLNISDELEYVFVVLGYIISTLDESELVSGLEHVAEVADMIEEKYTHQDKY